jgi:hypothetical protein
MGDALRRLFLAIGIGLGLASGQPDPSLAARVAAVEGSPGEGTVVVSARVDNAFAPGARELVEAGTRVALRFSAKVEASDGRELAAEETRTLRYDLRSGRYVVEFDRGKTAALVDPQAARTLASELSGLELCRAGEASEGARVIVRAEIGIVDGRGAWHDAPVLWNYFGPRAVLAYGRAAEGPPKGGR